ncbi:MAG: hypothetical protein JO007_19050 [Alphaproteobacteria bacterium]|nr:hypothetical protein [Alphaproteobacteria bacterium]
MAEPTDSTANLGDAQPGIQWAKMIVNELASAAQTAALSLVDQQKARAAAQVNTIAEALRAAARCFEQANSPVAADYINSAARQVDTFVHSIGDRHWTEIASDLEEMARHRPVRFIAGAVIFGFLAGRLLTAAPRRSNAQRQDVRRSTEGTVTAAVASGTGNGETADWHQAADAREAP